MTNKKRVFLGRFAGRNFAEQMGHGEKWENDNRKAIYTELICDIMLAIRLDCPNETPETIAKDAYGMFLDEEVEET